MHDKIIKCQECEQEFAWTIGEQQFYQSKGLAEPVRCLVCRAMFKAAERDQFRGKAEEKVKE